VSQPNLQRRFPPRFSHSPSDNIGLLDSGHLTSRPLVDAGKWG